MSIEENKEARHKARQQKVKEQVDAKIAADLLKVMAHPERLMVLCQLTQGEVGVGELQKNSFLSQSAFLVRSGGHQTLCPA